jgi:hypothetical protein
MKTAIDIRKIVLCFVVTIACSLAFSNSAFAQTRAGVKIGIQADPEQVYFGAHADVAEVVPDLWLRPNIEVGVGDNRTIVSLNGEFLYHFKIHAQEWRPYVGAGPAVVITSRSTPTGRDSDVGPGFNFLIGIEKQRGMLAEIKIGAIDSPSFKFGLGWNF